MDRIERVRKTFHNEPSDRLLVGFWHHYLEDELVDGLHSPEYVEQCLAGAEAFRDEFDPDFVKVMTDGLFFMPFNYEDVHCASDLRKLRAGDEMELYLERSVEFAKEIRRIYGRDRLIFYNVFSPTFHISQKMRLVHPEMAGGGSLIVRLIKEDPEAAGCAVDLIAQYTLTLIDRIVGAGIADGIYLSVSCYNGGIAPEIYRKYITPAEKLIIERANGYARDNILHICGWRGNRNDLSLFTDYDFSVINWAVHAEGVSLAEGKKLFGGRCVIGGFGNNNTDLLCTGTKEEIQNYVDRIVSEAGTTGVIIGADCTTHPDTPDEHLHWVYDRARQISEGLKAQ